MKHNMKATALKKIVVQCSSFWKDEFDIDTEIFDDVYMEAATRAVEKRKDEEGFKVAVIVECYEKKNIKKIDQHFCYNTYFILVNAGLHDKAEMLRLNFLKLHGIDLQRESIKGDPDDGGTENKPKLN